MSRKRKKTGGNPAKGPVGHPTVPATPKGLLTELTRSTADRVVAGLQLLEQFERDYPDTEYLAAARVAYQTAALALMEAVGLLEGAPPLDEQARKVLTHE